MPSNKPTHIAIILDGNRRFAKRLMLEPWKGHEYGRDKVEKLISWCISEDISQLTLYAFSLQNFNRPKKEFDYLMKIFIEAAEKLLVDKRVIKHRIKVTFLGRYNLLPLKVVESINKVMDKTKHNNGFKLNIALAYGGREEIIDAVKDIINQKIPVSKISEEIFAKHLYMDSSPDLIVRTGGEKRTSNFLPWQSIYSEWFFLDKTWPEFEQKDLKKILEEYSYRERRFGK